MTKDLLFLIDVATKASALITDEFVVNAKGDNGDLVTNFDYEIEKYIISRINDSYPGFDIISEEFNKDNTLTENCFTIDPIDGTVNFAHGIPLWVIQIACIKKGKVVASVIYAPKLNELYSADRTGAYLNGEPIHVTNLTFDNSVFTIEGKNRYPVVEEILHYTHHARVLGSAGIDYAFVSAGKTGATVFRNNTLWDYIPGMYLVERAGGYTIDIPGNHIAASSKEVAENVYKCCGISDTSKKHNADI